MFNKTCLVIYIGNGYSEKVLDYSGSYTYSVDMRDNKDNHNKMIIRPLKNAGYKVDTALITNKHKYYREFVDYYKAIPVEYSEISNHDLKTLTRYYNLKVPARWGPGNFRSGGRLLNLKEPLPEYDIYVFVRADAHFKKSILSLDIDVEKINFLWAETDYRFYTEQREEFLESLGTEFWFWNTYNRVNGNVFNVVPKKFIKIFLNYFWMEHVALHGMLNDLSPVVSYPENVHLMMGLDRCYVTDQRYCENPLFTFNKKVEN